MKSWRLSPNAQSPGAGPTRNVLLVLSRHRGAMITAGEPVQSEDVPHLSGSIEGGSKEKEGV